MGFGKEGNQFFDFIPPALIYQLFRQLEAEKKEKERQDIFFIIRGIHLYHGMSEVGPSLRCSSQERQRKNRGKNG